MNDLAHRPSWLHLVSDLSSLRLLVTTIALVEEEIGIDNEAGEGEEHEEPRGSKRQQKEEACVIWRLCLQIISVVLLSYFNYLFLLNILF